ncbi:MAG: NUDIX hydrolase [Flavobacteriales bacterium]|nr:NUDIX hydrolase [Flavobacteriales bacterium]MCB9192691.1 NUDIX hydrolase [Flavobacteriales bacterium]MCB9205210.1 NUDIX hydrolase [Flavobacteriales bacterium]
MAQSYKVFIGGSVLYIGNEPENQPVFNRKLTDPKASDWSNLIMELETANISVLTEGNKELNWKNFISSYKLIEAAGGLVQNQNDEWLFIHRNGMWDLPKGKLEKGESIEECAVREVAEECGIDEPTIEKPLSPTYHTYELKGKRILKKTYWYLMKSSDTSELIPQTEEGITEVKWVSTAEAKILSEASFGSIQEVIKEGLE